MANRPLTTIPVSWRRLSSFELWPAVAINQIETKMNVCKETLTAGEALCEAGRVIWQANRFGSGEARSSFIPSATARTIHYLSFAC